MDDYTDNTAIKVLTFLIVIGAITLGVLMYRQSKEPPLVLEEVVQTIELPESLKPTPETPQDQE